MAGMLLAGLVLGRSFLRIPYASHLDGSFSLKITLELQKIKTEELSIVGEQWSLAVVMLELKERVKFTIATWCCGLRTACLAHHPRLGEHQIRAGITSISSPRNKVIATIVSSKCRISVLKV
jgi:hypothetical protein